MTRPVAPLFEYVVYEDYISEFLCINKDKVELECNGKCYLMQRLSEQNKEKGQNLPKIVLEEYPIGFVTLFYFETSIKNSLLTVFPSRYRNHYKYLSDLSSFHPPSQKLI